MIPASLPPHEKLLAYILGELPPDQARALEGQSLTNPELAAALADLRLATEGLAQAAALAPPPHLRARILGTIAELAKEEAFDLASPPTITRHADAARWRTATRDLQPHGLLYGIPMYLLHDAPERQQVLLWLDDTLVENQHAQDEFTESFLILEGSCHCLIGEQHIDMQAGDFLQIPADTPHSIINTTPGGPVIAVVQRLMAA